MIKNGKKSIFDLGAHNGEDSDFYLRKGFRVVAVDASEVGSSGLFGDDLPGEWLSAADAMVAYKKNFWRYKYFGDDGPL